MRNLRELISRLRENHQIVDIHAPVDPHLEIAEIHRRVIAADGPALFFHNVKGSPFPVVTNLFGSFARVELAFGKEPQTFVKELVHLATRDFPPKFLTLWQKRSTLKKLLKLGFKRQSSASVLEHRLGKDPLNALPFLTSWPEDGGAFLTLPLVYTETPGGGPNNLGMYRIQRFDGNTTGLHFQIGKGAGFHLHLAEERNESLPVSIFLGGPPALTLSAIAPLPENVPEMIFASLVQGEKLKVGKAAESAHPVVSECEFALLGEAKPHRREEEGPFGDHYGYYSLKHPFPVFDCKAVYHRKGAIYPATVVGKPRQEDFFIGEYLQELLSPLFPVVMPSVKSLWSYGETGFHSLASAVVKERFSREAMTAAFRILGEGQLSLTKFLLLTNQPVNVKNIKEVLTAILERFVPERDLFIFANLCLDTLDYTGPKLNNGSRGVLLGVGEKVRDLPTKFSGSLPRPAKAAAAFSPGCLVVEVPSFTEFKDVESLLQHEEFSNWPLIILVDNLKKTLKSEASFLWTTFTRFEPAQDIYSRGKEVFRHHICYKLPLLIDARMKPSYPDEVFADEKTKQLVTSRWKEYFPTNNIAMGDSDSAHL